MKMIKFFMFFLFIFLLTIGCNVNKSNEVPANILSEEQFVDLLADIHIAEASVEKMQLESVQTIIQYKKTFFLNVLEHHELTQKAFNENYDFYSNDVAYFSEIYDKVLEELSIRQALSEEKPIENENPEENE